jgi:hypothetical protein
VSPASVGAPRVATASPSSILATVPERRYRSQSEKTPVDRLMARFAQSRLGGLLFITVFPAIDKQGLPGAESGSGCDSPSRCCTPAVRRRDSRG